MAEGEGRAAASGADIARLMTHSSIYAIGTVLNRVGVFLLLPVYTNFLSLADYGRLEMFYTLAAVAGGLLSVGLAHATLRFYFEYDDLTSRRQVVSTNLMASTVIAGAGALALLPFCDRLSVLVFGDVDHSTGIAIVLATMVLELSTQIGLAYLRATERSVLFISSVMARLVVQVGVNSWLVVVQGAGVVGILIGNGLAVAVGWLLVVGFTVKECGFAFRLDKAKPVLGYSFPFVLSTIVALVASNVDRIFIRSLLSFEALGLFALATKFSRLLEELIGLPFSQAYGAFRFSVMDQGNAAEIQARVARALFAVSLLAGVGVLLFAGDVLTLLSDESFAGAAGLLPPLVCAAVFRVMSYPAQTGILVRKRTHEILYLNLVDAVLYVGASFVLIQIMGLLGACIALAGVSLVKFVLTDRVAQRYFRVEYLYARWVRLALIATAGVLAGTPLLALPILVGVPVKLAILALTAMAMLRSDAFDEGERRLFASWVRALWRRSFPGGRDVLVAPEGRA